MPYTENFEGYNSGSTVSGATIYPRCWSRLTNYTTDYPYISTSYHSTGTSSLYFYATSTYYSIGILPPVDTTLYPLNTLMLNFKALKSSTTSGYGTIEVGVMTDPTDETTFTLVESFNGSTLTSTGTWYEKEVMFNNYAGAGNYIAFRAPATTSNNVYIDDVVVSAIPTCLTPSDITLSGISSDEVTVDWTPMGDETDWEVVAVPVGTDPDNGNPMQAFEHPFTYTGLTSSTSYDVYVRANCGSEYSPWSKKQTITTKCAPEAVPYVENFDNSGTSTSSSTTTPGAFPACWTALNNNTAPYPYISSNYHISGVGALYFYGTSTTYSYAASPAIDVSQYAAGTLALSFNIMKTGENYGRLRVGITTNPNYPDSMVVLKDFYPTDYENVNIWYPQMFIIPEHYDDPIYLVFYLPEGGARYAVVEDVMLDLAPDCPEASMLSVSQVTGSTALVTWSPAPYNALDYVVEYSEQGMNNWSAPFMATGDHLMLTGLNPETFYDVRLYTECASGNSNMLTASFRTGCLSGASDVTIGTGSSTTYYVPTYASTAATSSYSLCQQLWEPSELGSTPGNISSISLRYAGTVDTTRNYNIYMMHSVEHNIPNSFMPMNNATLVYSGNIRWTTGGDGWNTIVLDTVFPYR